MSAPRHPNHRPLATLPKELRRTTVPLSVRVWVTRTTGLSITTVNRLPGASSTAVHRLGFPDGTSLVLRRYVWPGCLDDEPIAPQREVEALCHASGRGVPAPHVIAADITGTEIGDSVPAVLMTYLPGRALGSPEPIRLAEAAATVHAVDPSGFAHEYFPWFDHLPSRPPSNARQPRLWERALEIRSEGSPPYRSAFIHRDFHPGNVLWQRGRCTGIVDWANACQGPVGCDVATCNGNLIDLAGPDVADRFVYAYESILGEPLHPYWEIASVLEHGPSPWCERDITYSERRLERALAALGAT